MTGILDDDAVNQSYGCSANYSYSPFIANPFATVNQTSRTLASRFIKRNQLSKIL